MLPQASRFATSTLLASSIYGHLTLGPYKYAIAPQAGSTVSTRRPNIHNLAFDQVFFVYMSGILRERPLWKHLALVPFSGTCPGFLDVIWFVAFNDGESPARKPDCLVDGPLHPLQEIHSWFYCRMHSFLGFVMVQYPRKFRRIDTIHAVLVRHLIASIKAVSLLLMANGSQQRAIAQVDASFPCSIFATYMNSLLSRGRSWKKISLSIFDHH